MPSCTKRVLRFSVRGGLSNQKECLVNAAIVAHALNVTLVLPHVDLIGRGNEQFEPPRAAYVKPYADRSKWGHFTHLFNATTFINGLDGRISLVQRIRTAVPKGQLHVVRLPSAFLLEDCAGSRRVGDACEARRGDTSLLERLMLLWRRIIATDCTDQHRVGPIIFDAGRSLCWNAYKSRHTDLCGAQYPVCRHILGSLSWASTISELQETILQGIARTLSGRKSMRTRWVAVHVRAFVCAQNQRKPFLGHVRSTLQRLGIDDGLIYLVSSISIADVQDDLPEYAVVGKTSFLGNDIPLKYPFEVLAAIDYGIAVKAPLYLAEPRASSFDAFAAGDRPRRPHATLVEISSTCSAEGR